MEWIIEWCILGGVALLLRLWHWKGSSLCLPDSLASSCFHTLHPLIYIQLFARLACVVMLAGHLFLRYFQGTEGKPHFRRKYNFLLHFSGGRAGCVLRGGITLAEGGPRAALKIRYEPFLDKFGLVLPQPHYEAILAAAFFGRQAEMGFYLQKC